MKKNFFKIFAVISLLWCLIPAKTLAAEATTNETTYIVTINAKHNNRALSYVAVMISQNGETITYKTTNRNGVATFNLADGTYTATVGYVSGNYSYYGTVDFTVNGGNTSAIVSVDSEFSKEAAKEIYDSTTYYDHVDIRVNGTFTTGSEGNLVTHAIILKNVELLVTNGETTLIDTQFTDNTETYEWRVTGKRIPNTAVVSLIFDIVLDGETVRENYVASFQGEEAFIQAIINCDQNQGLDFIIDPTEIVAAALYDVNYLWTGLPEGLANVPEMTEHAPNSIHTIDTQFKVGDIIIDEANRVKYTFSGWEEWSNAEDSHETKNNIGSNTELTITNDTIIYGRWTSSPIEPTSSHIIIKKMFSGNDGRLPENLLFKIIDSSTEETYTVEVSLSSFTYDEATNIYTYKLPIYSKGTYTIEELNYNILGYTFDTTNSSQITQEVTTDLTEEVIVSFYNVYTKNRGTDFHNSGFIVEKADADNRNALSGAIFTLTNQSGEVVSEVTTNDSGYAIFMNLREGTYKLKETTAPKGYHLDNTEYTVIISLLSATEVYSANQNAYVVQYEYNVTITPNDHYNSNGTRLTVFNEKITGSLTIKKDFALDSDLNESTLPTTTEIKVAVTGPENYSQTATLNKNNNWIITLNNLVLGKYTIEELTTNANVKGYNLSVSYNNANVTKLEVTLNDTTNEEEITITNNYTKIPEVKTGNLTITKEVEYKADNEIIEKPEDAKEEVYSFKVIIGNDTYTFELKAGESKTFENITYGTNYSVIEDIPRGATWTHIVPTNATGIISDDETKINMVNTYNIEKEVENDKDDDTDGNKDNDNVPQTGSKTNIYLYSIITLLGVIVFILTTLKYRKNI